MFLIRVISSDIYMLFNNTNPLFKINHLIVAIVYRSFLHPFQLIQLHLQPFYIIANLLSRRLVNSYHFFTSIFYTLLLYTFDILYAVSNWICWFVGFLVEVLARGYMERLGGLLMLLIIIVTLRLQAMVELGCLL